VTIANGPIIVQSSNVFSSLTGAFTLTDMLAVTNEVSSDISYSPTNIFAQDDEVIEWGNCDVYLLPGAQTTDVANVIL